METSPYEVPAEIASLLAEQLADTEDGQVLLIPRVIEGGVAIYPDSHINTAKDLRASGIDARFLVRSEDRTFISEFSQDIVYQIAIGIGSNLSWDAVKALWTYVRAQCEGLAPKGEAPTVRLQIARLRKDDMEIEGLTLEGPATEKTPEELLALLLEREPDA